MAKGIYIFKKRITFDPVAWLCSLSVTKRGLYTYLSLIIGILQLFLLVTDAIFYLVILDINCPSQNHTEFLLMIQVISFYWSVMGLVYSIQDEHLKTFLYALLSVVVNFVTYISRFCFEVQMIGYRVEEFTNRPQ